MEASQLEVRPEEAPEAQAPVARRKRSGPRSQSSPYTGVTRYKRTGKYEAHVWIKKTTGKGYQFHLGSFETIEDAARCYDRAAIKTRGLDNLELNFPAETYRNDAFLLAHAKTDKTKFLDLLRAEFAIQSAHKPPPGRRAKAKVASRLNSRRRPRSASLEEEEEEPIPSTSSDPSTESGKETSDSEGSASQQARQAPRKRSSPVCLPPNPEAASPVMITTRRQAASTAPLLITPRQGAPLPPLLPQHPLHTQRRSSFMFDDDDSVLINFNVMTESALAGSSWVGGGFNTLLHEDLKPVLTTAHQAAPGIILSSKNLGHLGPASLIAPPMSPPSTAAPPSSPVAVLGAMGPGLRVPPGAVPLAMAAAASRGDDVMAMVDNWLFNDKPCGLDALLKSPRLD